MICLRPMDGFCCWGSKTTHGEATFINAILTIWSDKVFRLAGRCKQTVPGVCWNTFQTFRERREKKHHHSFDEQVPQFHQLLSNANNNPPHGAKTPNEKPALLKSIVKQKEKALLLLRILDMANPSSESPGRWVTQVVCAVPALTQR